MLEVKNQLQLAGGCDLLEAFLHRLGASNGHAASKRDLRIHEVTHGEGKTALGGQKVVPGIEPGLSEGPSLVIRI